MLIITRHSACQRGAVQ